MTATEQDAIRRINAALDRMDEATKVARESMERLNTLHRDAAPLKPRRSAASHTAAEIDAAIRQAAREGITTNALAARLFGDSPEPAQRTRLRRAIAALSQQGEVKVTLTPTPAGRENVIGLGDEVTP